MAEKTVYIIDLNDKVTGKLKGVQAEAKKTDQSFSGIENTLSSLGIGVGIGSVVALTKGIFDLTSAAEQTRIKFEVMLGSMTKADALIKDIREFAAATPFETQDLEKAATTMLGFGVAAEDIMPNIKMLGDVSGGNAEKLDRLTYAFSQIHATGRLMGQDLLQLINAGFNPLQTISEKTGLSIGVLKEKMEDGLISAQMISEAFKAETVEGGRFFGMMEKQSQTMAGKMGTLVDEVKMLGLALGNEATSGMHMFIDAAQQGVEIIGDARWTDFFSSIWDANGGARFLADALREIGAMFGIVNEGGFGFQHILDGLTVAIRLVSLPLRNLFDGLALVYESIKSLALAGVKLKNGDLEGAANSFNGIDGKFTKVKENFTKLFDFEDRGFGESLTGKDLKADREKERSYGLDAAMNQAKGFYSRDAFSSLTDPEIEKKKKSKRQGAGGLTLNESRNGSTNIVFNIDTFQKNEFSKDGTSINNTKVSDFLEQMRLGLMTVLNDSQIVARQ